MSWKSYTEAMDRMSDILNLDDDEFFAILSECQTGDNVSEYPIHPWNMIDDLSAEEIYKLQCSDAFLFRTDGQIIRGESGKYYRISFTDDKAIKEELPKEVAEEELNKIPLPF